MKKYQLVKTSSKNWIYCFQNCAYVIIARWPWESEAYRKSDLSKAARPMQKWRRKFQMIGKKIQKKAQTMRKKEFRFLSWREKDSTTASQINIKLNRETVKKTVFKKLFRRVFFARQGHAHTHAHEHWMFGCSVGPFRRRIEYYAIAERV